MEIKLEENGKTGSLFIEKGDNKVAEINWNDHGDYIEVDETRVNESLKGQGIGLKLFVEVVKFARDRSIRIKPVCPFVVKMFERHPEEADLIYDK